MNIAETLRGFRRASPVSSIDGRSPEAQRNQRIQAPGDLVCGVSDVGSSRETNEDAFYVSDVTRVLIVADGMGGHNAGDVASAAAVDVVRQTFESRARERVESSAELVGASMRESLLEAHRRVLGLATDRVEYEGMGTTLLLAFISANTLYTCHVGDVRCYIRSATGFQKLTQDHSIVASLVRDRVITEEQARVHPRKNEILQALGTSRPVAPEVTSAELREGDRVLLCTDGLWEALSDEEIASVLSWEGSMRQVASQLVDRANGAGASDNITVILYEHR